MYIWCLYEDENSVTQTIRSTPLRMLALRKGEALVQVFPWMSEYKLWCGDENSVTQTIRSTPPRVLSLRKRIVLVQVFPWMSEHLSILVESFLIL